MSKKSSSEAIASWFVSRFPISDRLISFYARQWVLRVPFRGFFCRETFPLFRTVLPYTMVSYRQLRNIYDLTTDIEARKLPGALVECGVWKGGCAGVMASVAQKANPDRQVWLFDSFEGLPAPSDKDGENAWQYAATNASAGDLTPIDRCVGPIETLRELFFQKLKINERIVNIRKGWFQDTLPAASTEIGPIAILRIDADWYESTQVALEKLYDLVVPGGYVILDDYHFWQGCRTATDEFMKNRQLQPEFISIDHSAVYFRKPG